MIKKCFSLGDISRKRDEIFGLAIISIMIFHFSADFAGKVGEYIGTGAGLKNDIIMTYYSYIGSIGVEIFTFLSGVGLYYSYSNNSNTLLFYKKRAKRIIVPYLIVACIFWLIKDFYFLGETAFKAYVDDVAFITLFTEGTHTIWFIGLMLLLYVLFPIIYKAMDGRGRMLGFLVVMAIAIGLPIYLFNANNELYGNISIAITRIPIFVLGVFFGKLIKEDRHVNWVIAVGIAVCGVALKVANEKQEFMSYLSRYADAIYALGLIVIIVVVLLVLDKVDVINKFLRLAGAYSLELYMVHVTLRNLMKECGFDAYRISQYFTMILIAIIGAAGLNVISTSISNKLFRA